jgi:hypothetical protein
MIFISLLHTFAELTLILFLVRIVIAMWPDSWVARSLTFTYG